MRKSSDKELKNLAEAGSFDLEEALQKLGQGYADDDIALQIQAYRELGNYYSCVKADPVNGIALCNFALSLAKEEEKNKSFNQSSDTYVSEIIKEIKVTEKSFLFSITGKNISPSDYTLDQAHQEYLKSIREEARALLARYQALTDITALQLPFKLSRLGRAAFMEEALKREELSIKQIYQYISEQMRSFVHLMIEECQQVLGPAPCQYAIICFGSLARDEATPYSDLEFGILIDDLIETFQQLGTDWCEINGKEYSCAEAAQILMEQNKGYFQNLTQLLNIKVINLGETTPRMQYIKELRSLKLLGRYSESPTRHGFCFDGNNEEGRKTPLGNKFFNDVPEQRKYELILTVHQMAELQSEENFKKDPILSTVVKTAALISGSQDLLIQYQECVENILYPSKNGLQKKIMKARALGLIEAALDKFEPKMGLHAEEGHFFNIKYDFYRLPNILIEHLSDFFMTKNQVNNTWDKIDNLNNSFGLTGSQNLKILVSEIEYIRLHAYLSNDSQDNHLVTFEDGPESIIDSLQKYHKVNFDQLCNIYYVLMPLYYNFQNFLSHSIKSSLSGNYYDNSLFIQGVIYEKFFNYSKAIDHYHSSLRNCKDDDLKINIMNHLISAYYQSGNFEVCKKYLEEAVQLSIEKNASLHDALLILSSLYAKTGEYAKALELIGKIRKSKKSLENPMPPDLNFILFISSANIYSEKSDYQNALLAVQCAIRIQKEHLPNRKSFQTLALEVYSQILMEMANYSEAKDCLLPLLEIKKQVYGINHQATLITLHALGRIYRLEKKYSKAKKYFKRILNVNFELLGRNHLTIEKTYLSLGLVYVREGKLAMALDCFFEALEINESGFGRESIYTAKILLNLGLIFKKMGRFDEAQKYYQRGRFILETRKGNSLELAYFYHNIANLYDYLDKDNEEKIELYKKALDLKKAIFSTYHPTLISTLHCLFIEYIQIKAHDKASECAKEIEKLVKEAIDRNFSHSQLAENTYQLSNIFSSLGDRERAEFYLKKSIELDESLCDRLISDTCSDYDRVSDFYFENDDIKSAEKAQLRSLKIFKEYYGNFSIQVASKLYEMGDFYCTTQLYHKAIECFKQSIPIFEAMHHEYSPDSWGAFEKIVKCYEKLKDPVNVKLYQEKVQKWKDGNGERQSRSITKVLSFLSQGITFDDEMSIKIITLTSSKYQSFPISKNNNDQMEKKVDLSSIDENISSVLTSDIESLGFFYPDVPKDVDFKF